MLRRSLRILKELRKKRERKEIPKFSRMRFFYVTQHQAGSEFLELLKNQFSVSKNAEK